MPDSFKFYGTRVTSTSSTSVATPLTGTRIINSVIVCNTSDTTTATLTLQAYDGTASFTLVSQLPIGTQTSSQVLLSPLPLSTGEDLEVIASESNLLDVVVSVLERT